jgi:hypothetical protein
MAATSTAPRKAAPKKRAAATRAAADDDGVRAPVVLDPEREAAPVDTFLIFAIGDQRYYAPLRPHATVELKYLYLLRHEGTEQANGYLLETLVGHDGYVALMNYDALEAEDLTRIFTALQEAVRGAATNGPKETLKIT